MRVLIVDDDPIIRSVVSAALEGTAEVVEAHDGPAGLAVLDEVLVDAVLLDVMMPGVSGYEVLARLRGSVEHRDLPVIMLTAKTAESDHVTAYRTGADAYVTKPFDVGQLCALVADVARRGPAHRDAMRQAELGRAELLRQLEHQFGA